MLFKNKVAEKVKRFIQRELIELSGNFDVLYPLRNDGLTKEDIEYPKFKAGRKYELDRLRRELGADLYK